MPVGGISTELNQQAGRMEAVPAKAETDASLQAVDEAANQPRQVMGLFQDLGLGQNVDTAS